MMASPKSDTDAAVSPVKSSLHLAVAAQLDLSMMAQFVHKCIQEDDLSKLRERLMKRPKEERKKIVDEKVLGNTPLFTASYRGKVHFVNFLLNECGADVESKGIYEVEEDRSKHQVTPLWCAAVANKIEVVKALVEHGAEINSPSDTESTPVRSACYMTNVAVIKFLVNHGADIHKPNCNGGTCLINAIQDADLCKFLINQGANVNAVDNSGNLALHYAIREGIVDSVKLLLQHNSDFTLKNDWGDNALQTAALRGSQNIVEIILDMTPQTTADAILAYELLGTNFVDEKNDMVAALTVWKKAMSLRYLFVREPILKELPEKKSVYKNFSEPQTVEELNNIYDPEEIHMLALLMRERILGPQHKDTTFGLMYRGAVYADSHNFQRCVDLWKYAYSLRYQKDEPLNQECLFTIQALVKLFWEIQTEVESGATDDLIQQEDVVQVFEILSDQIISGKESIDTDMQEKGEGTALSEKVSDIQLLMQLYLHMIHLFSRSECSETNKEKFMKLVHRVLVKNPLGSHGETLLHLAVDPKISLTSEEFYSPFPSLQVTQILVSCGADMKAQSNDGSTPLLTAVKVLNYSDPTEESIIKFLLQAGSHIDVYNNMGESPFVLMESQGLPFFPLNYINLRCLSSRVIMKYGIPYKNEIPQALTAFVEMHGKCKADL
ncbi:protein fem-1 homolog C-like isoform X1 [Mercenaria mercenaria]|uniref:protein fem-1 homolog C-like isoform X1 n=2 Tax=Mercenaria mercenaria TaxID=6596 RepID=UPI001E1DCDD8|nr:protein fem-1 homolog C-like isoform X1 [Mercenaria mercenaria]